MNKQYDDHDKKPTETRTDLAEDRTDWAQERTMLAKQRTYASWVRTGLATLAVGFASVRLLGEMEPQWLIRLMGGALIGVSGVIFTLGYLSYRQTLRKLQKAGLVTRRGVAIGIVTAVLVAASIAGILLLFID
ncbi:MAG: YidH family protein [Desulfovibrionales bacterium]